MSESFFETLETQLHNSGFQAVTASGQTRRRQSRRPTKEATHGLLTLTEVNGVLRWEDEGGLGPAPDSEAPKQRASSRTPRRSTRRDLVRLQMEYEVLPLSKIPEKLEEFDQKFSPQLGLRSLGQDGLLREVKAPRKNGKILLFVHGTFSNNDHFISELNVTSAGRALLGQAHEHYDQILVFDHWTLSVSPVMNALDLSRRFAESKASIDVISHSRGGLVARWWHEAFDHKRGARRLFLVGSPLGGTSIVSAPKLRSAMNLMSNVGKALETVTGAAATVVPLLTIVSGLMRIVSSMTSLAAKTPLADAVIAMIPGLAAQSRIANNPELARLRLQTDSAPEHYYAIRSNFQPSSPGWEFWKYFTQIKSRAANLGADTVFKAPNDLVVDTDSMTYLNKSVRIPRERTLDFRKSATVHHLNYFRQTRTVKRLGEWLF